MKVCSCSPQRQNKSILSFLAPPYRHRPRSRPCWITILGRALQWDSLAPSPITDITPLPRPTASGRFVPPGCPSGSVTGAKINSTGPDGCLPELDMFPPVAKLCVYGICAFVLRCFFLFSHCTLQMEHSLGVHFFFLLLPLLM